MKNIRKIIEHKKAFLEKEKLLLGKNTISGYLHDIDKLFLCLFFNEDIADKIHKHFSKHHVENVMKQYTYDTAISFASKNKKNITEMIIDWECSKDISAREHVIKNHSIFMPAISLVLKELGL